MNRGAVEQQPIRRAPESAGVVVVAYPLPDHFVTKLGGAENRFREHPQPVSGGIVAVQVDASGGLQNAAHFEQAHGHHTHIGLHAVAMGYAGSLDYAVHGRVPIRDQSEPRRVQVVQRPGILERRPGGPAADGRRVVAIAVEGRVQVDQVYRLGVEPAQDVQVVAGQIVRGAKFRSGFPLPTGYDALSIFMLSSRHIGSDVSISAAQPSRGGDFKMIHYPTLWRVK